MIRLDVEWSEHLERFESRHDNPLARRLRDVGLPLVFLAGPAWMLGSRPSIVAAMLLAGWLLQCGADLSAGERPSIVRDARNVLVAPIWWMNNRGVAVQKTQRAEVEAADEA